MPSIKASRHRKRMKEWDQCSAEHTRLKEAASAHGRKWPIAEVPEASPRCPLSGVKRTYHLGWACRLCAKADVDSHFSEEARSATVARFKRR